MKTIAVIVVALALGFTAGFFVFQAVDDDPSDTRQDGEQQEPSQDGKVLTINPDELAAFRRINAFRVASGLRKLEMDDHLTDAAVWMATDMAVTNQFGHVDSLGRGPFTRLSTFGYSSEFFRGENLAAGNEDAAMTVKQWIDSRTHREVMLDANYRAIGIARILRRGSRYTYYWATEYGSRVIKPL